MVRVESRHVEHRLASLALGWCLFAVLAIAGSGTAAAYLVTFDFAGTIVAASPHSLGGILSSPMLSYPASSFSGSFTFESETPDSNGSGTVGSYNGAITSLSLSIAKPVTADAYQFGLNSSGPLNSIAVNSSSNAANQFYIASASAQHLVPNGPIVDGDNYVAREFHINLVRPTSSVMTTDTLPGIPPSLSPFSLYNVVNNSQGQFRLVFQSSHGDHTIVGNLNSLMTAPTVAPVPLPAAAWLFGSGVIGMIGLAERHKKRHVRNRIVGLMAMRLNNRQVVRMFGCVLCISAVACMGAADLSYGATIGFIGSGPAAESTVHPPVIGGRSAVGTAFVDKGSDAHGAVHSIPELRTGGLNAITRAILNLSACVCSGVEQMFGQVSTKSTAPVAPAPAVPGALWLFMIGIVTVAGVTRNPLGGFLPAMRSTVQARPSTSTSILLVSDDQMFVKDLAAGFARYGQVLETVPTVIKAGHFAAMQTPALVLLDRRQADWHSIRHSPLLRVVPMMTIVPAGSGVSDEDCLDDFDYGMDGTHVCDGNARLLVARVRALLRRSAWREHAPALIRGGNVELDIDRFEVRVAGQAHHLPPVQFKLLKCLMESPGRLFRRQELLDHIWGEGYAVEGHTLDVHICWLRRLLAHDPSQHQAITTVRGVGVKFVVEEPRDRSAGIPTVWSRKPAVRRSRLRSRHASRPLRVVRPAPLRTAV